MNRLRPIEESDNLIMGRIIRDCLIEFDANQPGTAWEDPELNQLFQAYSAESATYYVAISQGEILGGAGIAPLKGGMPGDCELQKMYLSKNSRGSGIGSMLMTRLLDWAKEQGYQYCYLETLPNMKRAHRLYEIHGFKLLTDPRGNTGHHQCGVYYGCTLT